MFVGEQQLNLRQCDDDENENEFPNELWKMI